MFVKGIIDMNIKKLRMLSRATVAIFAIFAMISLLTVTISTEACSYSMTQPVETIIEQPDEEELIHLLFAKLVYDYLDDYEGLSVKSM